MSATSHLRSLQALELAVRTGSLKTAADALAITPAAVGQSVKALEDFLGLELVARGRSGLKATASLQAALPHLAAAFRELDTAASLLDMQRGQEIHVAAVSDFADLWLRPRLSGFKRTWPNISFCINGEGEAPLRLGSVDCEIRFGPPSAAGETLFRDYVLPISSPENFARISRVAERDSIEGFPLLHLDFYKNDPSSPNWPTWTQRNGFHRTAPDRGIRFQRIGPALEAVLADAGLVLCGVALAAELIESGRLSLPFPPSTGAWTGHPFHARFRTDALARPQVRRFRDWLGAEASKTATWLQERFGSVGVATGA
jgi:LysR family glycine cleavage system transcriptional activator